MLVYDITNEKSFDNIRNWIRNIEEVRYIFSSFYSSRFIVFINIFYLKVSCKNRLQTIQTLGGSYPARVCSNCRRNIIHLWRELQELFFCCALLSSSPVDSTLLEMNSLWKYEEVSKLLDSSNHHFSVRRSRCNFPIFPSLPILFDKILPNYSLLIYFSQFWKYYSRFHHLRTKCRIAPCSIVT